ncbi:sensor histidine kinase [Actinomadura rupiterrae]|uniref:sensor histidine kinase n=1 Tax=Actinomadura rupiterrae TaxID=559627 RepID=UPI0020A4F3E8|nr:histidine kinase [Actinomadura rupiterrae]MCP2338580.1 signal transduction histidine kinase [Actinomadura rupiterrae]
MVALLRAVTDRVTWRRWAYLVMGAALLMPYWFLLMLLVGLSPLEGFWGGAAVILLPVPAAIVTGLVAGVRQMEGTAVKELVGGPLGGMNVPVARTLRARAGTGAWFSMHLHVGVVIGAASLALPPFAVVLLIFPFLGGSVVGDSRSPLYAWKHSPYQWLAPPAGLACVVALLGLIVIAGRVMAALAPRFLGPTPEERVVQLEERAAKLAERNRLARELHDSVGHALSVVTLQAGAAARVLDQDPAFAREALSAIEECARSALADLDHVLGLLREDKARTTPQPTLADLDRLVEQTRIAGVELDHTVDDGVAGVPAAVSREAYRIVQEGLTNALRHAGKVPVTLRITVADDRLRVLVANPLSGTPARTRDGGGRGLGGIRERVTVLRGDMAAGPDEGEWRMEVSLPLMSGA